MGPSDLQNDSVENFDEFLANDQILDDLEQEAKPIVRNVALGQTEPHVGVLIKFQPLLFLFFLTILGFTSWRLLSDGGISSKVESEDPISKVLMHQQVFQKHFDRFLREHEVLILWVGQDVIVEAGKGYDQLPYEPSNQKDSILLPIWVSHIIYLDLGGVVFKAGCSNDAGLDLFQEEGDSVPFSGGSPFFLPLSLLLFNFLLPSDLFLLVLFPPLVLLDHGLSMSFGLLPHGQVEDTVDIIHIVPMSIQVKSDLAIELRDKLRANVEVSRSPQEPLVH